MKSSVGKNTIAIRASIKLCTLIWILWNNANAEFNYFINNGSVTITGYNGGVGPVVIPATIDGVPVDAIAASAFENNQNLTEVAVPKTLVSIGTAAFASCPNLTAINVDVENSNYKSNEGILYDADGKTLIQCPAARLGNFECPVSVTNIKIKAFAFCGGLTNIELPNGITAIGESAFASCFGITSFSVPSGVTSIANATFSGCTHLGSVRIPAAVTNIGDYAFTFSGVTNISLPEGTKAIGTASFSNCSKLSTVFIPASVEIIGQFAFSLCTALRNLYFEGNCPSISPNAFSSGTQASAFVLPVATGWDSFSALPIVVWSVAIDKADPNFGAVGDMFGFMISGADGLRVVVEATASLETPLWHAVATNTLSSGLLYREARSMGMNSFYRVRSP
jgi:hypothetical protein